MLDRILHAQRQSRKQVQACRFASINGSAVATPRRAQAIVVERVEGNRLLLTQFTSLSPTGNTTVFVWLTSFWHAANSVQLTAYLLGSMLLGTWLGKSGAWLGPGGWLWNW